MFDEDEDIYDAVIQFRKNHPYCNLCNKVVSDNCEHPKNGYCENFRQTAKIDAERVNMKKVNFEIDTI